MEGQMEHYRRAEGSNVAYPSDIGNAFNDLVDTLLLSGTPPALAAALNPE
jgi:hypothetical protein